MKGVDGIVFVADSQRERFEANIESLQDMLENLKEYNIEFESLPYVLQLNKRDLPNITPANELIGALRKRNEPVVEAMALKGEGVVETLKSISKLIMIDVKRKLK
jgi:mutual gliding-motility protein MglA